MSHKPNVLKWKFVLNSVDQGSFLFPLLGWDLKASGQARLTRHMWSQYFHFPAPSHISTIFKTPNLFFCDHDPEHKLHLICTETWPAVLIMPLWWHMHQVEKYRPPRALNTLSSDEALPLLSCGQPRWHHPLNKSSKSYLPTLIKKKGRCLTRVITNQSLWGESIRFSLSSWKAAISTMRPELVPSTSILKDANEERWHIKKRWDEGGGLNHL